MKRAILLCLLVGGCFIDELPDYKDDGSHNIGTTPAVRSLAVGPYTTCAVLMTGKVRCWGSALVGLGGVYGQQWLRPVASAVLTDVQAIAIAPYHGCVLSAAGVASCYGMNDQGQIGNGQILNMEVPLQPTVGGASIAQIEVASSQSGARRADGTILTWGANFIVGQTATPTAVDGVPAATELSIAEGHRCAVHGGMISCWGGNTSGELGRGTISSTPTVEAPAPVIDIADAMHVLARRTTCALHMNGTVSCWGAGFLNPPTGTPTLITGLTGVQQLVGGEGHICALITGGTVTCIGDNESGQLGNGSTSMSTIPVAVPNLTGIVEVAAGGSSTCARRDDGEIFCWGVNIPGDGSMTGSPTPVQVRW